ncbi:hypothetical protein [Streptomyces sp. G-G2]|uniref:hypothetical protein n=1 Tax=Streptomyces sp. G-G2 TaxID=3046201 RepID=UPI0024BAE14A|nr:hypothetical protein [Streptomyces sp. G-G2]MDJ0382024.1 hypothetical protein [Streptomyces sp. G-G2]
MSAPSPPGPPSPFIPLHTAVVLLIAALVGLVAGGLTFLAGNPPAVGLLAGLGAAGTSIPVLRSLIG